MTVSFVPSHPALLSPLVQAPADPAGIASGSALLFPLVIVQGASLSRLATSSPLDGHARPGAWRSSPELPAVAWSPWNKQALAERAV